MQGNHEISPTDDDNVQQTHHNPSEDTHVKTLEFPKKTSVILPTKNKFWATIKRIKEQGSRHLRGFQNKPIPSYPNKLYHN